MEASGLLQSLFSLIVVLGAIFGVAWLLRRVQGLKPRSAGSLRVHAGLSVGGRERVVWIEAGGKHLLLGVAPGRVQALHVFDQAPVSPETPETAAAGSPQAPNFGDLLKRALGKE